MTKARDGLLLFWRERRHSKNLTLGGRSPEREEAFSLAVQGVRPPPPTPDLEQKKKVFQLGRNETWLKIQSLLTSFPVQISFSFLSETNLIEMSFPRTPPQVYLGRDFRGLGVFRGCRRWIAENKELGNNVTAVFPPLLPSRYREDRGDLQSLY